MSGRGEGASIEPANRWSGTSALYAETSRALRIVLLTNVDQRVEARTPFAHRHTAHEQPTLPADDHLLHQRFAVVVVHRQPAIRELHRSGF
jgi:hypothetical protein